jgi:hypothetical protein
VKVLVREEERKNECRGEAVEEKKWSREENQDAVKRHY